jgi:hypothetical protein
MALLEFAGYHQLHGMWHCQCECGTVKVIRREVLLHGKKGACDRCAKLAKPAIPESGPMAASRFSQVEMARRLGVAKQWVGRVVDFIEGRQPKRRSKTHWPHGHRYTEHNIENGRDGWRRCRTCRLERDRRRKR